MKLKNKLVCGVATNNFEGCVKIDNRMIKSHNTWSNMLKRCYSTTVRLKYPTYSECTVCDAWLEFSNFKEWYDGNYREGFHLDKDVLVEGNKVYSPDTCRFIPQNINNLLNDHSNSRGDLPKGICRNGKSYIAQCSNGFGKQLNKTFKTIPEASKWYSETKKNIVNRIAEDALNVNDISVDVYNALIARKF